MTTHPPLLFFSGLLLALTQCGAMAATADFTGGNGTTATDQYTGIAGDGWLTPWERKTSSGSTTTVSVIGTTPFSAGAGNYLNIDYRKLTAGNESCRSDPAILDGQGCGGRRSRNCSLSNVV